MPSPAAAEVQRANRFSERDTPEACETPDSSTTDPFDEIDFGSFFDDYLDPGYKSPASENVEKPSFETFLSQPQTLPDYLHSQLSVSLLDEDTREAAESIIGNLDEDGYLTTTLDEMSEQAGCERRTHGSGAQSGTVARSRGRGGARSARMPAAYRSRAGTAKAASPGRSSPTTCGCWRCVSLRNWRRRWAASGTYRYCHGHDPRLNPRPGIRYSGQGARTVEPDVYYIRDGDDFIIQMNDDELPQLRLNAQYKKMLDRDNGATREVRDYVRERYTSAIQLMKNIEQRKQTIIRVCEAIKRRQMEFLSMGIDYLKPMMIKDVAEEVGVHPSTVSRAVASKYAHTPHGVYELRYFFSEAVQGPSGGETPLLLLKRKVKKMIEEEDQRHPLTDEQITSRLQAEGIDVTRRTVAKYREDLKIPSTHQRRVRN